MASPISYNYNLNAESFNGGIWNYFGGIARAVLGRPTGKFRSQSTGLFPMGRGTVLMDVSPSNLLQVAMHHPHLNTIISRGAELFSMMVIKHMDKDGEEIEDSPVLKILAQPNPLQNQEQYTFQFYVHNGVYNKTFQHLIRPLSFEAPKVMWLLPPGMMKINVTGKIYRQTDINEIITNFEMLQNGIFETQNMIYMAEGIGETPINPVSRIEALQIPLSNINESLKSRNIIVSERGAIGILSRNPSKDGDGYINADTKEKKKIEDAYQNNYGLDSRNGHVIVTSDDYKWVPINFNIGELGLIEGNEDDFARLCDSYGHDRDLYSSTKGATFENKSQGVKSTIQLGIQPLADKLMRQWTKTFLKEGSGEYLEACYDHLPAMQEDELKREQTAKAATDRYSQLYRDGQLTPEQYAILTGIEFEVKGGPQSGAQANLRGLVGSVSGIAAINQLVSTGFMDPTTAQNIFVAVYGYEPTVAAGLVTTAKAPAGATPPAISISSSSSSEQ